MNKTIPTIYFLLNFLSEGVEKISKNLLIAIIITYASSNNKISY
jgi:hypothetical protein